MARNAAQAAFFLAVAANRARRNTARFFRQPVSHQDSSCDHMQKFCKFTQMNDVRGVGQALGCLRFDTKGDWDNE